jgi:hypothetical protein
MTDRTADTGKQRYFKIDQKGPAANPYSASSVKRRKREEKEQRKARRRLAFGPRRVVRSHALADPMTGDLLVRETGTSCEEELPNSCWASGLEEKGTISMWPELSGVESARNISHFYIDGQDTDSGLGVVYGCMR